MAKVTKIIATLVGSSALWLGGTAYISSNTQSELNNYVTKANKLYESNGMKLSVESFEKGFFTSTAKMKIDFMDSPMKEIVAKTFKLPMVMDYNIENGPLFFKEGLGIGASRITTHFNFDDYVTNKEEFRKYFKDGIEFTSSSSVGFSKNTSFVAKTNKIVLDLEGDKFNFSPLNVEGEMNIETFQGQLKMVVDTITSENDNGSFKAKDVVLDADITKFFDNGFYLGDFLFTFGSIDMKGEDLPFELKNAKVVVDTKIDENDDKTVNMNFKLDANVGESTLPKDYASLGRVELAYALNGAKLEGLLAFQDYVKKLQEKQQDIMGRLISSTGEMDMDVYAELEKMQREMQDKC